MIERLSWDCIEAREKKVNITQFVGQHTRTALVSPWPGSGRFVASQLRVIHACSDGLRQISRQASLSCCSEWKSRGGKMLKISNRVHIAKCVCVLDTMEKLISFSEINDLLQASSLCWFSFYVIQPTMAGYCRCERDMKRNETQR